MTRQELKEHVYGAADSVAAAGGDVTLAAVVTELGAESLTGIVPLLQEWRIKEALASGAADEYGLWATLVQTLEALDHDLETVLEVAQEQGQSSAREDVDTEVAERLSETQERLVAAQSELAVLRSRLEEVEDTETDIADQQGRIEELVQELADTREAISALETEKEAMFQTARAAETRAEDAEQERRQLEQADRIAEETLKAAGEARQRAETELVASKEEMARLHGELSRYKDVAHAAQEEAERAMQQLSDEGDWLVRAEDWPELPRQLAIAQVRIAALRAERDALLDHLDPCARPVGSHPRSLGQTYGNARANDPSRRSTCADAGWQRRMPARMERTFKHRRRRPCNRKRRWPQVWAVAMTAQAPQSKSSAGRNDAP